MHIPDPRSAPSFLSGAPCHCARPRPWQLACMKPGAEVRQPGSLKRALHDRETYSDGEKERSAGAGRSPGERDLACHPSRSGLILHPPALPPLVQVWIEPPKQCLSTPAGTPREAELAGSDWKVCHQKARAGSGTRRQPARREPRTATYFMIRM